MFDDDFLNALRDIAHILFSLVRPGGWARS
jgi:hypothetical protein